MRQPDIVAGTETMPAGEDVFQPGEDEAAAVEADASAVSDASGEARERRSC